MPAAKREYSMVFPSLSGGLNIWDLDYRISADESPDMKNLLWKDGCLNSRDGQTWVDNTDRSSGHAMHKELFHGFLVYHAGTKLYCIDPDAETPVATELYSNSGLTTRGTFFIYDTNLYYKSKGFYIKIRYNNGALSAEDVVGFVPVIIINASPENGSGDSYQPENRISSDKTIWYNADGGTDYHLPVVAGSIVSVYVDGEETTAYDYSDGVVTFNSAPPVTDPPTNNTVRITYRLANTDAYKSIMDCPYAGTFGGTGALCVIMGGCPAQPNAYFWNGNNIVMDPTYFPMEQYQLAGDANDSITGFGSQQNLFIIFKEHSVGRTKIETSEVTGSGANPTSRLMIDMPYTPINSKIGCDLPWTIELIENNLVWCNTEQGVHILKDSSWAYENNVIGLSKKVNGSPTRKGLLDEVRSADPSTVCSCDDTRRYWLTVGGHVYLWDYSLSEYKEPSWFYFTDIDAQGYASVYEQVYHVDSKGRITKFERVFADYGGEEHGGWAIHKVYQFATQFFNSYDNLKNVNSVIIATRSDTNGTTSVTYITDYEKRRDLTDLKVRRYRLHPRNLSYRSLDGRGFAEVFRRKPFCLRIKHFTMRLENQAEGEDLSVVSAQIFYNYQGRDRGRQVL